MDVEPLSCDACNVRLRPTSRCIHTLTSGAAVPTRHRTDACTTESLAGTGNANFDRNAHRFADCRFRSAGCALVGDRRRLLSRRQLCRAEGQRGVTRDPRPRETSCECPDRVHSHAYLHGWACSCPCIIFFIHTRPMPPVVAGCKPLASLMLVWRATTTWRRLQAMCAGDTGLGQLPG